MKRMTKGIYVLGVAALALGMASCGEKQEGPAKESTSSTTTEALTTTEATTTIEKDDYKMTLYAPGGAPGISVVDLEVNATDKYTVETNKSGQMVKAALEANQIDAIIAPFNFGLDAYNGSSYYELGAVVTWGNLYLVSQNPFVLSDVTAENTILFSQKGIPGMVTSYVLGETNHTKASDFTYLGDSKDTVAQLAKADNADKIYLVAEPALTAAKANVKKTLDKDVTVISVQDEYKKLTGQDSFPQAALFLRKETVQNHKAVVDEFLKAVEAACKKTETDTEAIAAIAVEKELFANATVLTKAMPKAAIRYVSAKDAKASIEAFVKPVLGGDNPADGFYY